MNAITITKPQRRALNDYLRGMDQPHLDDYGWGPLAFYAREKVITALERKGLIQDGVITDAGRAAIAKAKGEA